jgi:hypothetical protein
LLSKEGIEIGKKILRQRTDSVFLHYTNYVDKETFDLMTTALETVRLPKMKNKTIPFRGVV